nr:uncharacterized protein LOC107450079 [Parasteatoda tepidariorum]
MDTEQPNHYKTAFAMIIKQNGITIHKVSTRVTDNKNIFSAELMAIKTALTWINQQHIEHVTIYTDCMSSLHALADPEPSSVIIEETKQLWRNNIKLNWVKALVGIQGNEKADEAAKNAISSKTIDLQVLRTPKQV